MGVLSKPFTPRVARSAACHFLSVQAQSLRHTVIVISWEADPSATSVNECVSGDTRVKLKANKVGLAKAYLLEFVGRDFQAEGYNAQPLAREL